MRKVIITSCLVFSALIILDSFQAGEALLMFFLAGIIPGTNMVVSASIMFDCFMIALGFVFARLSNQAIRRLTNRLPLRQTV